MRRFALAVLLVLIAAPAWAQTTENASKLEQYGILNRTGPSASKFEQYGITNRTGPDLSKIETYVIIAQSPNASKFENYAIICTPPGVGPCPALPVTGGPLVTPFLPAGSTMTR